MNDGRPEPVTWIEEASLRAQVEDVFQEILQRHFSHEPGVNLNLPVETRAYREIEGWRVFLLLTPWMLARLLFPAADAGLSLPGGWQPGNRFQLLGPMVHFTLLESRHKAHLHHHPRLGTFLIQPLILNMQPFDGPETVYRAWNQVIQTRDRNRRRLQVHSPWHEAVSRREFFTRLKS